MKQLCLRLMGCTFALVSACGDPELGSGEGAMRAEISAKLASLTDANLTGEVTFRSVGSGRVEMSLHLSDCVAKDSLGFALINGKSCGMVVTQGIIWGGDRGQHFMSVLCKGGPVDAKEERTLDHFGWTLDDDPDTGLLGRAFAVDNDTRTQPGVPVSCGVLE